MSIILNPEISCYQELKALEAAKVVEALSDGRTLQSFSSLKIGIVNLMPTKEATERQWSKLMMGSHHWVEPVWIQMETHLAKHTDSAYLEKHYIASSAVDWRVLDGLIITGAPVELMAFEAVDYWFELVELIDRATAVHVPILAVCWGAQALLYKRYGIEKQALEQKCFGVFEHSTYPSHPMTAHLPEKIHLPHSRHTGWDIQRLTWHSELEIVIQSEEAGIFAMEDSEGDWYWSGHPEYDQDTLVLEYQRDLAKGLEQAPPSGYKAENGGWQPEQQWHSMASKLLNNWIDLLAPKTTLLRKEV